ncbi:xanthine dehydrogenase [Tuber indicum]|nr:xanthine dehydrogenase [Tuber indicum]
MGVGRSINPAIDYGQIGGASVQGQDIFIMKEIHGENNGELLTRGLGTYKILPGLHRYPAGPQLFNPGLLGGVEWAGLGNIWGSGGIGEPPFFCAKRVILLRRVPLLMQRLWALCSWILPLQLRG